MKHCRHGAAVVRREGRRRRTACTGTRSRAGGSETATMAYIKPQDQWNGGGGHRGARRGGEAATAHKCRAEQQKDAARKDGPSAGRAVRRWQHNSSQGNGGRALQDGEARERGEWADTERLAPYWTLWVVVLDLSAVVMSGITWSVGSVRVGAQAAKAPVPMLAGSGRAGVAAAYQTMPKMRAHGPVGTLGYTPKVLGEMGPRSGRGGAGEAARQRG
ncbi:hypothetical protein B0H13DRAFT_1850465 [Mycena leptocephala]|nr:hypothetical protein B0H13DRAFT_1850465 [Mycena leptocephala]